MWGAGYRMKGVGCGVKGEGGRFGDSDFGIGVTRERVQVGAGSNACWQPIPPTTPGRVKGVGCGVWGAGYRVKGVRCGVQGIG